MVAFDTPRPIGDSYYEPNNKLITSFETATTKKFEANK